MILKDELFTQLMSIPASGTASFERTSRKLMSSAMHTVDDADVSSVKSGVEEGDPREKAKVIERDVLSRK